MTGRQRPAAESPVDQRSSRGSALPTSIRKGVSDRSGLLLGVVLIIYSLLAVAYSVTIPLGEAPDEVPHFTYVRYLAQHRRLPTAVEEHEAFQPPLYYLLGAALSFGIRDQPDAPFAVRANAHFDVNDPRAPKNLLLHTADEAWPYRGWALAWHVIRLLSIALGAITIWAIYQLGHVLFTEPAIPLAMAALTAFTPQFIFMSAVVNNDNAATALAALILMQVAALLHDPPRIWSGSGPTTRRVVVGPQPMLGSALPDDASSSAAELELSSPSAFAKRKVWKRGVILGALLGFGLLTKASLIALVPIVGMAIVISDLFQPEASAQRRIRQILGDLVLVFGLAALISGWYLIRNWVLHGDLLGWGFILQVSALREGPLTPDVLAWLFRGAFRSFWLGWIGIAFDGWIYWLLGLVALVGLAGFIAWLFCSWDLLVSATRWTLILLGLHVVITLASLVQWTATVLGTDQGRLIYPILSEVMLALIVGWAWWSRGRSQPNPFAHRRVGWVLGGLVTGMLCLAILTPIRYIAPVHSPAPIATEAELAGATPLNVDWSGIRLLGYRLEQEDVQPGEKLVLYLYWQADQPVHQDLMALIQLLDQDDQFLMYMDGSPTAGRDTTDRWPAQVPLASRHLLPIPEYGRPGEYRLTLSLHPFGEPRWMPATAPDGTPLGDRLVLPEKVQIISADAPAVR